MTLAPPNLLSDIVTPRVRTVRLVSEDRADHARTESRGRRAQRMLHGLSFGTWLKQRRRVFDLTQADLAGFVGCSVDTIYRFESGARRPSKQVALRLAAVLHIADDDLDTFLRLARSPSPDEQDEDADAEPFELPLARRLYIPMPPTPLIERTEDIDLICDQLQRPNVRLLTIVGIAGVGKTRLSLQIAEESLTAFPDGVFFVALDTVGDGIGLEQAIARTLDIGEPGGESLRQHLIAYLRDLEVLLVLDNVEQIRDAADTVAAILMVCPLLRILVTSRERLMLWSEWVWDLEGLRYPTDDTVTDLMQFGAVQLFVQRAQQVRRRWRLDERTAPAVAAICRLVEGLPLAIELAASAVRDRDVAEIARMLQLNALSLEVVASDLPERHRSINNALDHSWQVLDADEQRVFPMLSVFRSGWTAEAAVSVADADVRTLQSLVERSLVRHTVHADGSDRYGFHPVIQQYARERCRASADCDGAAWRHLAFYRMLAAASERAVVGPHQTAWLARIEREHDDLRAALRWALDHGVTEDALAMTAALTEFWYQRGYWQEGRTWFNAVLAAVDPTTRTLPYGRALAGAATLARCLNDYDQAIALYEQSIPLCEEHGDGLYAGRAMQGIAETASNQREYVQAVKYFERSLQVLPPHYDREIGHAYAGIGEVWLMRVDLECAATLFDQSLIHFRRAGDKGSIASSLTFAAAIARRRGDYDGSRRLGEEALALCRELGHKVGTSWALRIIGTTEMVAGDLDRAEQLFAESLLLRWDLRDKQGVAWGLEGFAEIAGARALPARAARLWGKAAALRDEVGAPTMNNERAELERTIAKARAMLDAIAWDAAWQSGQRMPTEEAVRYAVRVGE